MNISAAEAITDLIKTNLGPKGTQKLVLSGAGDISITKDGGNLLADLPVQHPTIALIQRICLAVDDVCGDGTTETVLFLGELLKQSKRYLNEKVHPRVLIDGFQKAKTICLDLLKTQGIPITPENLFQLAYTTLNTKLEPELAKLFAQISIDAVEIAKKSMQNNVIDLHLIEILTMQHHTTMDSRLINGMVFDHGWRHQELQCSSFDNCYILTINVGLEYEKAECNTEYKFTGAEQKVAQALRERSIVDKRVEKILALKKQITETYGEQYNLIVFNMQGIDPISLQQLASQNIMALRRVKRRNLERLTKCTGGHIMNDLEGLSLDTLGFAQHVYEELLGEEKYTILEGVKDCQSATILINGPSKHIVNQISEALRDSLRSIKNALLENKILYGGCNFEVKAYNKIISTLNSITDKSRAGMQVYADSLLQVIKVLANNSGFDGEESAFQLVKDIGDDLNSKKIFNIKNGETIDGDIAGVYDQYNMKSQIINSCSVIATQILLVDEILKAGRAISGGSEMENQE